MGYRRQKKASINKEDITLLVPNKFHYEWLESKYRTLIDESIKNDVIFKEYEQDMLNLERVEGEIKLHKNMKEFDIHKHTILEFIRIVRNKKIIREYDDDFITNDMEDILSAIHVLKEALDYKSNYPKNVVFSSQEEVFVNYAIEELKGLHTHIK